jgi:hypothetical protein
MQDLTKRPCISTESFEILLWLPLVVVLRNFMRYNPGFAGAASRHVAFFYLP